jgi:hypothetical protein
MVYKEAINPLYRVIIQTTGRIRAYIKAIPISTIENIIAFGQKYSTAQLPKRYRASV